jgi:ectoine hydroxylase-related dioxygenase (phytanoyl-CoA dioxygenase family)
MFFRPGVKRWSLNPREESYWNADTFAVQTQVGDMLLFPSDLLHFVPTVTEDVARVAISINSFFQGTMGTPVPYGTLISINDKKCGKGCKNCKCKS